MIIEKEIRVAKGTFADLMEVLADSLKEIGLIKVDNLCDQRTYVFNKGQIYLQLQSTDTNSAATATSAIKVSSYYIDSTGSQYTFSYSIINDSLVGTGFLNKTARSFKIKILQKNNTWCLFIGSVSNVYMTRLLVIDCNLFNSTDETSIISWSANWSDTSPTVVYTDLENRTFNYNTIYYPLEDGNILHINHNLIFEYGGQSYAVAKDLELYIGTIKNNLYMIDNRKYQSFGSYCLEVGELR